MQTDFISLHLLIDTNLVVQYFAVIEITQKAKFSAFIFLSSLPKFFAINETKQTTKYLPYICSSLTNIVSFYIEWKDCEIFTYQCIGF